jgi:serine/threonine protein phosphatase PrpC
METIVGFASKVGRSHAAKGGPCEDRYRILDGGVPLVARAGRGQLFAVMDGVGDAPRGMNAAQLLADRLLDFFRKPESHAASPAGLRELIMAANVEVNAWGNIRDTTRPLGAAAFTIGWMAPEERLHLFHAGDTMAALFDGADVHPLTPAHASGRAITSYLGIGEGIPLYHRAIAIEVGQTLVLLTDGIYPKGMRLGGLRDALLEPESSVPGRAADRLVQRAISGGSKDDVTTVVVELESW